MWSQMQFRIILLLAVFPPGNFGEEPSLVNTTPVSESSNSTSLEPGAPTANSGTTHHTTIPASSASSSTPETTTSSSPTSKTNPPLTTNFREEQSDNSTSVSEESSSNSTSLEPGLEPANSGTTHRPHIPASSTSTSTLQTTTLFSPTGKTNSPLTTPSGVSTPVSSTSSTSAPDLVLESLTPSAPHESPPTSTETLRNNTNTLPSTTQYPSETNRDKALNEESLSEERTCLSTIDAISMKLLVGEGDSVSVTDSKIRLPQLYNQSDLNVYSIDYHFKKRLIFFTGNNSAIFRINVSTMLMGESPEKIVDNLNGSVRIAVDWIRDKIYWMSDDRLNVEMANLDGSNRTTLFINSNFYYPNNIVVDPYEEYLFIVMSESIFRFRLDGRMQTIIQPDLNKESIGRVKCLALSHQKKRLFFSGKNKVNKPYVASCAYNGSDARIHKINDTIWNDIISIDVFRDKLFFVNYEEDWLDSLASLSLTEEPRSTEKITYHPRQTDGEIWSIKVFHPSVQDPSYKKVCLEYAVNN